MFSNYNNQLVKGNKPVLGLHPVPPKAFCIRDEFCGIILRLRIHKGVEGTWDRDEAEERKERTVMIIYYCLQR